MAVSELLYPNGFYVEEKKDSYARIVIPLLEKSYAITVGNALRRVLLSSIEGYAVVAVNIEGVDHEFTAMDGVLEDVPYIVVNLKRLNLKVDESLVDLPARITLNAKGPGEVKASDLELPAGIEIVNSDQHILTITTDREVRAEIFVDKGIGFYPMEDYEESYKEKFPINTIFVDGNFSPVEKVNFTFEKVRYGSFINKEKLTLEIWTNGTVDPVDAYLRAIEILKKYFDAASRELTYKSHEVEFVDIEEFEKSLEEKRKLPIEKLGIPQILINFFQKKKNINTVGDLVSYTEEEIADWLVEEGFTLEDMEQVKSAVKKLSLNFAKKSKQEQ